jgi:hypothetical protein
MLRTPLLWAKFIALIETKACAVVMGLMLIPFLPSLATAVEPSHQLCVAVTKKEYDSAKRKKLNHLSIGTYMKTGRIWRRYYWYCH